MRALLALPPCAIRYTEVLRSPCTQRTQSEQLCLCLWQVDILCAPVVTRQCSLPPLQADHENWLSSLQKDEGKKGDVCPQYLSPSYACMDFCFDFHLALISPPPPQPPLRIVCYFLCALASQRYERDFGPPHTTLYHTGIPLRSLTPLKHVPPLSLLWQRFQISSDTLLSLMCVPQYRFEEWKRSCGHSCHLFTPAFGQIHRSTLLHFVCFSPCWGNSCM